MLQSIELIDQSHGDQAAQNPYPNNDGEKWPILLDNFSLLGQMVFLDNDSILRAKTMYEQIVLRRQLYASVT